MVVLVRVAPALSIPGDNGFPRRLESGDGSRRAAGRQGAEVGGWVGASGLVTL